MHTNELNILLLYVFVSDLIYNIVNNIALQNV